MHIGVRCDSDELDSALRRALAPYVVEGLPAPPNFSLQLPRNAGAAHKLNLLYRAHTAVIRTRWRSRVVRGLLNYLDEFLGHPRGLLQARVFALVKDGRAYVVPRLVEVWLDLLSSPVHRAGFQFVDSQAATVDLQAHELVVPEWRLQVDTGALEPWQRTGGREREPAPVAPGRYPIAAWAVFHGEGQALSRESALLKLFQSTVNAFDLGVPETLRVLETFGTGLRVESLGSPYQGSLAHKIVALAS